MMTPGLCQHLVDELHLTIATTARVMLAQMSENITIEDVVRLFTGDGITIPQISDTFEWAKWPSQDRVQGVMPAGGQRPCRQ